MEPPRGGGWGPGYSEKDEQSQGLLRDWGFESKVRALLNPRYKKKEEANKQSSFLSLQTGKPLLALDEDLPSTA